jgi:3-deoxy-D-manno-octulosonic-acid transferase
MILLLYNFALIVALVVSAPWWLWRMATTHKYRDGLLQRLGRLPSGLAQKGKALPLVWLHAVSVGEVLAVTRLVRELDAALPGYRIVISTTTRTGQALARERFGADRVFYAPLDLPWAVRAYLDRLQPQLLILAETEFWPNLLSGCFRRGVPIAVVNARISDRSWPRYWRLRRLWRPFMSRLSRVLAQSEVDATRLLALGCRHLRLTVAGNLKFDVRASNEAPATRLLKLLSSGLRLVVAGSTLEGEEAALLQAWPQLLAADPQMILVIAPRHPERFNAVAEVLNRSSLPWLRRSEWPAQWPAESATNAEHEYPAPLSAGQIVLLDTIGELASVYSLAAVAFVGGSLVQSGGHNPLEPAQFGVPIVMGPSYVNFRAITEDLVAGGALRIAERSDLSGTLCELLADPASARAMGERARHIFEEQAGATGRSVAAICNLLRVKDLD